jgi:lactose/L-arabinose transport system ATP-binding protein
VREPDVFLFDEPLSNLDAELRVSMRIEIARLHRQLGNTMIYVTHDQTEAMTLADKIVVLRDGRVEQVGTPRMVYEDPDNIFVAGFIGSPRMNLLQATKDADGTVKLAGATLSGLPAGTPLGNGDGLIFGIRPEHIEISAGDQDSFDARVDFNEYLGSTQYLYCTLDDGQSLIVERREGDDVESASRIQLTAPVSKRRFFQESGERIR